MGLTWQDVAGQVAAPDFSDAASMITKGIQGIGQSVADIGAVPEARRRQEAALALQQAQLIAGLSREQGKDSQDFFKDQDVRTEKKNAKEFGAVQSVLEAGAREAALHGKSFDDFMKTNEAYLKLPEGARVYGASHLSDAYLRGDETRMQQQERAADNARDERHFQMNYNLSAENTRLARIDRQEAAAERRAARELAAAGKPKVWKTGNDKTDKAMTILANTTGRQWNEATGAEYETAELSDLGKGYKNLGAVTEVFGRVNRERAAAGKPPLPTGVLKRLVDSGVGANSFFNGPNDIDDKAIKQTLEVAGDQFDTAYKGKDFYERLSGYVEQGARPDQMKVDEAFNSMFPRERATAPRRSAPTVQPIAFNNMGGSKY